MTRKNEYLFPIIIVVAFITWLLLGSFVVSKDIFDLCYLIVLYVIIFIRVVILK